MRVSGTVWARDVVEVEVEVERYGVAAASIGCRGVSLLQSVSLLQWCCTVSWFNRWRRVSGRRGSTGAAV